VAKGVNGGRKNDDGKKEEERKKKIELVTISLMLNNNEIREISKLYETLSSFVLH
jgi:hypothetical protein